MRKRLALVVGCALSMFLPSLLCAAEGPADWLAKSVLDKAGVRATVCEMPQAGDGTLAAALARAGIPVVHALASDARAAEAACKPSASAGVLGSQVIIETGTPSALLLGDWVADLYLVTDATDASLKMLSAKEAGRVLSPYRGVAVVGNPAGNPGGLTKATLAEWAQGTGGIATIREDRTGLWAVVKMPPLPGGDDWTHYAHGADQNRRSTDDALKYPYLLQWTGKPYYDGKFDMVVAAGGRLFRANSKMGDSRPDGITARSAYNGQILWQRPLAEDFGCFGSLIVATPKVVYLKDGNGVLCLDAETGAELRRLVLSNDPQTECRWLMLQDGILVTVLGPRPPMAKGTTFTSVLRALPVERWGRMQGAIATPEEKELEKRNHEVARHWFQGYDRGTDLAAIDAVSGKVLWRLETPGIDPAKTAISADRLFFYADRSYASCLDLKTGKTIWKTDAPIAKHPLGTGFSITFMITERVGGLASPEVYMINSLKDGHYQAFSAKDGSILWGQGHGRTESSPQDERTLGRQSYPILMDGKILEKGGAFYDLLSGKPTGVKLAIPADLWGGCGAFCVSTHAVHPMCGTSYDLDDNVPISHTGEFKAACLSGVVPADGLLFSGHGNCEGCAEWLGYQTFRSAEGISLHAATSAADRLLTGKAVSKPVVEATPRDWTTYRANNSRSGSSLATVSAAAKLAWTWTPNPPFDYLAELQSGLETQSTQPVCVGDRVFFGTAVGIVRCLDRKTGEELWNYPTAGRIVSAPTFCEGKLYVGSGDGRVYCLDVHDGSLVWRYRVAPIERRIMVYSHLMSAWPVNANVLVESSTGAGPGGAVAYASAGLLGSAGGTYLCALDAETGRPRWQTALNEALAVAAGEKDVARQSDVIPMLPSATGQMAWYQGNLWLHAGDSGVFVVDAATGKAAKAVDIDQLDNLRSMSHDHMRWGTFASNRGQDIGIHPGGWVVLGGKQFYHISNILLQPRNTCAFLRAEPDHASLDAKGYPELIVLLKTHGDSLMPAWDAQETLLMGDKKHTAPALCRGLGDLLDAEATAHPFDPAAAAFSYWNTGVRHFVSSDLPPDSRHRVLPDTLKSNGLLSSLLAPNAVVYLSGYSRQTKWDILALSRTGARMLWDIALPAQPLIGGLSMTCAGDVLVPLVDGRVVCIGGEAGQADYPGNGRGDR